MIVLRAPSAIVSARRLSMSDLHLLMDEQLARLSPHFPKRQGKPPVGDRRFLNGIIYVNRKGLRPENASGRTLSFSSQPAKATITPLQRLCSSIYPRERACLPNAAMTLIGSEIRWNKRASDRAFRVENPTLYPSCTTIGDPNDATTSKSWSTA